MTYRRAWTTGQVAAIAGNVSGKSCRSRKCWGWLGRRWDGRVRTVSPLNLLSDPSTPSTPSEHSYWVGHRLGSGKQPAVAQLTNGFYPTYFSLVFFFYQISLFLYLFKNFFFLMLGWFGLFQLVWSLTVGKGLQIEWHKGRSQDDTEHANLHNLTDLLKSKNKRRWHGSVVT